MQLIMVAQFFVIKVLLICMAEQSLIVKRFMVELYAPVYIMKVIIILIFMEEKLLIVKRSPMEVQFTHKEVP